MKKLIAILMAALFLLTFAGCGEEEIETHYVSSDDIEQYPYATCLGCGELLDLNYDVADILPLPTINYSINGSYLLPNGIAVLVDEDIEAYLNGTLQFYPGNNIPVTQ